MTHRIAAVIVVYRPQPEIVLALIRAIAVDVERIFIYRNNTPFPGLIENCAAAAAPTRLETLGTGANAGLGRAYNEAAQAARDCGCDLVLLFDEDSSPHRGMPGRLAAAFDGAGGRARRIAAVGPRPVAADWENPSSRAIAAETHPALREPRFLISSGSLIDLEALAEIGPFREDFFIDGIDIEWCFRARSRGFRCVMAMTEDMPHRLGVGSIRVPWLGFSLIDQTPARLFTHARNQAAMARLPHIPLWWKARAGASIALRLLVSVARGFRGRDIAAILGGVRAGFRLQLGPPIDAADRHPV